jgi:hypothetical protein
VPGHRPPTTAGYILANQDSDTETNDKKDGSNFDPIFDNQIT